MRTVVHALAYSLKHLDVDDSCAAVVTVVLELLGPVDAVCSLYGGEGESGVPGDAGDD